MYQLDIHDDRELATLRVALRRYLRAARRECGEDVVRYAKATSPAQHLLGRAERLDREEATV